MPLEIIIQQKNVLNKRLYDLYSKNYKDDLDYTPEHRYNVILTHADYWIILINNETEKIIGTCSITIVNHIYIIDDVFIEEEFRGNNYAEVLLKDVLKVFPNKAFKIKAHNTGQAEDIAAFKTYFRVFGQPYKQIGEYVYFRNKAPPKLSGGKRKTIKKNKQTTLRKRRRI